MSDPNCTCEPAVSEGAYRVEGEIRRDCPIHGERCPLTRSEAEEYIKDNDSTCIVCGGATEFHDEKIT